MTPVDVAIVESVRETCSALGYSPTYRELTKDAGCSLAAVHKAVGRLVDQGVLDRRPGARRGLSIAGTPDLRRVSTDALEAELGRRGITFRALSRITPLSGERRGAPCAAEVCNERVGRGMLFCRRHWFIIPRDVRDEILRAVGRRDVEAYQMAITRARDLIDRCDDGFGGRS